jgi:hypothetical protein
MNLRECNGRVPILTKDPSNPYTVVDFPKRGAFDALYANTLRADSLDKNWNVLKSRSQGATLQEAGKPYALTKERVRQIEAKFLRLLSQHYWKK